MADPHAPQPDPLPPVPTQMVYAVRGVDRIGGNDVQTVIEAPNVDAARRIADQKSLDVHDITLMHPLNGAEALKAARADPTDRFNQPGTVTSIGTVRAAAKTPAEPATLQTAQAAQAATAPPAAAPLIDSPTARPPAPTAGPPALSAQRPTGFAGPSAATDRPQRTPVPASVAAAVVLACLGGLLYATVLHERPGGGLGNLFAGSPHRAAAGVSASEVDPGPMDVEKLIAATRAPAAAATPILPRAQRGPGRSAYRNAPAPKPTAPRAKTQRPDSTDGLRLTALSPGGAGKPASVVINGQVLRPGESIGGHSLIQILDDSVVLERQGHLIGLGLSSPEATGTQ